MVCAGLALLPVFFLGCTLLIMQSPGTPHEEPIISAALAVLALLIVPVAPFVRENMARVGIGNHLRGAVSEHRNRPVYSTFATANIAAFLIAQAPALFGFIIAALTRSLIPLGIGSVISYISWFALWPRRLLWVRWTWQAKIGREGEESVS
jgi:hypothetical protein